MPGSQEVKHRTGQGFREPWFTDPPYGLGRRERELDKNHVFCKIDKGAPDGIRCGRVGRIFSSAGDGVHIFLPSGERVGKILVPERPSNLYFGGKDGNTLFITARTSLYSISLANESL